jgi:hypothetical protein
MAQQLHPTWFKLSVLGIVSLLFVALVIVTTVLVASRHRLVVWQQIKSALAVLIWVVPATSVVWMIGYRSDPHFRTASKDGMANVMTVSLENVTDQARSAMPELFESPPARLAVRSISTDDPKWTSGVQTTDGRELICRSSQRFATLIEAEEQITTEALTLVKEHYKNEYPLAGDWQVPVELVNRYGVKDLVGEVMDKDFGNGFKDKMYRAHLRLDYSPELQNALHVSWRGQTARHRLLILGSIFGLVTLMLGTSAGYFKLDDATDGAYRRRLKLAAAALISAGSLAAVRIIG